MKKLLLALTLFSTGAKAASPCIYFGTFTKCLTSGGIELDNAKQLRFYELSSNGTDYVSVKASDAMAAPYGLVWPSVQGSSGASLANDGAGNLSWAAPVGPGGSSGQVQFNNAGAFGGDAGFFWNNTSKLLGLGTITPGSHIDSQTTGGAPDIIGSTSYGANVGVFVGGIFVGREARGTKASPTASQSNDDLAVFGGAGYTGSAFTAGLSSQMILAATQTWTPSANGSEIRFATTANGTTNSTGRMVIANDGNVGVGTSTPTLHIDSQSTGTNDFIGTTAYGGAVSSNFVGRRARGTQASPTVIQNGDAIASLLARGYTGSAFSATSGGLNFSASENWSPTANGTDLQFFTAANGTTSNAEKMRLTNAGKVGIGTTTPSSKLEVDATTTDTSSVGSATTTNSSTTADGSNTIISVQGTANEVVDAGFTNDKLVAGGGFNAQRVDGTDDGTLHELAGVSAITQHQSGAAGTTEKVVGVDVTNLVFSGNVTNLYDFMATTVPAGGTVTNHYGLYLSNSGTTATNEWGIYEATTAQNFFNGVVSIGAGSPTQTGDFLFAAGPGEIAGPLVVGTIPASSVDQGHFSVNSTEADGVYAASITNNNGGATGVVNGLHISVAGDTNGATIERWEDLASGAFATVTGGPGISLALHGNNPSLSLGDTGFPALLINGGTALQSEFTTAILGIGGGFDATNIYRTGNSPTATFSTKGHFGVGVDPPLAVADIKGNASEAKTGTADVTSGTNTVVGTGTLFTSEFKSGDAIQLGSEAETIDVITDDTNLTTLANFPSTHTAAAVFGDGDLTLVENAAGTTRLKVDAHGALNLSEAGGNGGNVPHACHVVHPAAGTATASCAAGERAVSGGVDCGSTALFISANKGSPVNGPWTAWVGSCTSLLNVVTNTTILVEANCCAY